MVTALDSDYERLATRVLYNRCEFIKMMDFLICHTISSFDGLEQLATVNSSTQLVYLAAPTCGILVLSVSPLLSRRDALHFQFITA